MTRPWLMVKCALAVACLAVVLPCPSAQAVGYSESFSAPSQGVHARGSVYLSFTWAVNEAYVRVTNSDGRAGSALGYVFAHGKGVQVENPHTTSLTTIYSRKSAYYGTGGATAVGKACIDVPWWFDSCSEGDVGRA